MTSTADKLPVQTQSQRRLKYGTNVLVACVLAVVLCGVLVVLASRFNRRIDMTSAGFFSLKPQTRAVLAQNRQKIRIVSLYSALKRPPEVEKAEHDSHRSAVADLLAEYSLDPNVSVEMIDPIENPTKVDDLIREVSQRYSGEIRRYQDLLDTYPAKYEAIRTFGEGEVARVEKLPLDQVRTRELMTTVVITIATIQEFPQQLAEIQDRIARQLRQQPPDYKRAVDSVREGMESLSVLLEKLIEDFEKFKTDEKVPQPIREYMAGAIERYNTAKQTSQEIVKAIDALGELKLDAIRQSLNEEVSPIVVMGDHEIRVLPFDKIFQATGGRTLQGGEMPKRRFAGEQQITSAILALQSTQKPRVTFVRPGGPPFTSRPIPGFRPPGQLFLIAERLREYNFEVLEKDLSGTWALEARMQGMFADPEPPDDVVNDSVWVVLNLPMPEREQSPTPTLTPKLLEHINRGGSALILFETQSDPLTAALSGLGIRLRPDLVGAHEVVRSESSTTDLADQARRIPFVFVMNEFGDHSITNPIAALEGVLAPLCIVEHEPRPGVTVTPIIPVPASPPAWGESDWEGTLSQRRNPTFDPSAGDVPLPLFAGIAAEVQRGDSNRGTRLVVIGSIGFTINQLIGEPDREMAKRDIFVARFPANQELVVNSLLWLSGQEAMIAISPSAMEVSRIARMSDFELSLWRSAVILVLLPGAVLVAGAIMYVKRRG